MIFNDIDDEEVLRLIIKYCNNLESIAFNFDEISDELMGKFGLKFREKLHEINFIKVRYRGRDYVNKCKELLRLCPNFIAFGDKFRALLSQFF
jgi:hypothetical protein